MGRWHPELEDVVTFCCTEVNDPAAIDRLVAEVAAAEVGSRPTGPPGGG
jgi:hypothetical protein